MKRSQFIESLVMMLVNSQNIDVPNSSYINDAGLSEEILKFFEDSGFTRVKYESSGCSHSSWEACSCGYGSYDPVSWEKE